MDFCRRTRLPRPIVENLIRAGAMDRLTDKPDQTRRDLLWELGGSIYQEDGLDLEAPLASASSRRRESPHWPRPPAWTRFSARVVTLRDFNLSISDVICPQS